MTSRLILAGTGRKLGLPVTMESDITAVQIAYRIKTENPTFIFGLEPLLQELVAGVTKQQLESEYVPNSRAEQFSGEKWEEIGNQVPVNIYMAKEGKFLQDGEIGLVIETFDVRFAWLAHHIDSIIVPHIKRILEMGTAVLKMRLAVRKVVAEQSDRQSTDLCKLFLLDPEQGMTIGDLELFGAMFKVVSPLESSPVSMKFIAEHYSPAVLNTSAVVSADIESEIGVEIGERLFMLLNATKARHLNLYIKAENDEEVAEEMSRFEEIINQRLAPLVICIVDGDIVERAQFWMRRFKEIVGLEQNSMGLEYPEKQFGLGLKAKDDEEIASISEQMKEAGYTIDGYSFMVYPDIHELGADTTIERSTSYKIASWDDNYIVHSLPLLHEAGVESLNSPLNDAISLVIEQVEAAIPHDYVDDDPYPGRYSGWWIRKVSAMSDKEW